MKRGGDHVDFLLEDTHTLSETSQVSPAVASWDRRLQIAWTGRDRHLNVMSSSDGGRSGEKQRLSYTSYQRFSNAAGSIGTTTIAVKMPPSLTATPNGLHIAWTGSDTHLRVSRLPTALDEVPLDHTLAETSSEPLSVAALGAELVLAWTSHRRYADILVSAVNLLVTKAGRFVGPVQLPATSRYRPAVCTIGSEIVLAWTATDRRINVVFSPSSSRQMHLCLDEKTSHAPALASLGDDVVLAWTGTDHHVNLVLIRDGTVRTPMRLNQRSSQAPAVGAHFGDLFLAWTGSDGHLNIAPLSR